MGEIAKLGFIVYERSVARCLRTLGRRGGSAQSWRAFLTNHRELIAAFDLFTVPTATFQLLYCFFVIEHDRRKILPCNVTAHPDSGWVVQQLREAFPETGAYRYVIFDRDDPFNADVVALLDAAGLTSKRTSVRSLWQNGIAERGVGGCRRELLDHVIPFNERHLRRRLREYVDHFQHDRVHDSLAKDTPLRRPVEEKPHPEATVISSPRLGGLHHRYFWSEAA